MTDATYVDQSTSRLRMKNALLRAGLYFMLIIFALYYLMPLFVMVVTSLKSLDEIRTGSLLGIPRKIEFAAWGSAWSGACIGVKCEGLQPYFWNSVLIAVPEIGRAHV